MTRHSPLTALLRTLPTALALSTAAALLAGLASAALQAAEPTAAGASAAPGAAASTAASAPSAAASAPPVSVTLVRAAPRDFTITLEASGTVVPLSSVEVKPQVSSQLLQVHVKEGQFVKAGQLLFTLDARVEEANLKKAQAQLLKDETTLADARRQLARSKELVAQNFISQVAVDTAQANVDAQQAVLAADRAAIDAVRAQLSYSRISAPGAGRIGPVAVFVGSSVSPSGPALLTITQIDPVAVAFSLPQRNLADALAALGAGSGAGKPPSASGKRPPAADKAADKGGDKGADKRAEKAAEPAAGVRPGAGGDPAKAGGKKAGMSGGGASLVTATLPANPGATPVLLQGRLIFVDSTVDAASGTVKVKARFDNKDLALWPGAFVNVSMALQTLPGAIVVPQAAIVQSARGTIVFVADKDNRAAARPVKLLASAGTEAVVSGLKPGERVVLDGRQNLRPGSSLVERPAEGGRRAGGPGGAASAPGGGASQNDPAAAPGGQRPASGGGARSAP